MLQNVIKQLFLINNDVKWIGWLFGLSTVFFLKKSADMSRIEC